MDISATKDILRILEKDARTTHEQIARMTGLSKAEVDKAIRRAEAERAILRYKTVVNWEKLDEEMVWALVEVKVVPQRDVGFDSIAARIYRFPEARSVYLVSGDYDLAVLVAGRTMQEVAGFVFDKLAPLDSIQGTATHFLLRRYKEDGEILHGGEETVDRLPVSP
jgi:DNA-binding Lrp family transcriptional regulator